jgi:hypothetical protein
MLAEKPWLDWFVDGLDYDRAPEETIGVQSRALQYLTRRYTPSYNSRAGFERRRADYLALEKAKWLAVMVGRSTAIRETGAATFEGGDVTSIIAIHDIESGQLACAFKVSSEPMFVITVKQDSPSSDRAAQHWAEREAVERALWSAARIALQRAAPGASFVEDDRR